MSELLESVLEAHGGRSGWESAMRITARVRTGGLLPRMRFPGNRLLDYRLTIELARPLAILDPFPQLPNHGVFEDGEARVERPDGVPLERRSDPRSKFSGVEGLRRNLRWDALDSVYFAGYAMWNYLATPLLLARQDVTCEETEPPASGDGWRTLAVSFPAGFPTHSRSQRFHFDAGLRLVRHDYTAEVVAPLARAAHHCAAHREYDGLLFPTVRRVRPLLPNGRSLPGPTLVALDIRDVEVER